MQSLREAGREYQRSRCRWTPTLAKASARPPTLIACFPPCPVAAATLSPCPRTPRCPVRHAHTNISISPLPPNCSSAQQHLSKASIAALVALMFASGGCCICFAKVAETHLHMLAGAEILKCHIVRLQSLSNDLVHNQLRHARLLHAAICQPQRL